MEAVRRIEKTGESDAKVAKELGVNINTIHGWLKIYRKKPDVPFPWSGKLGPEDGGLYMINSMQTSKQNKKLSTLFKKYKGNQIFLCILISLQIILAAYSPFLIKDLIDLITTNASLTSIFNVGVFIAILTAVNVTIGTIQKYFWHKIRLSSINFLRLKMFDSALKKTKAYFDKHNTGEILAKIMDDVVIVAQNIVIGIPMLYANILTLIIVLAVLFKLSVSLAVVSAGVLPIYYIVFNFLNKRIRHTSKMERERFSIVMGDAQEKLLGVNTIKVFKKQHYMVEKFKDTLNRHFKHVNKNVLFNSIGNGASSMIMSLLPIVILVYGGYLINNSLISLGSLIAFYTYLSKIYEPLSNLSDYNMGLQTALGMSERILEFLDADLDVDQGTVEISDFEYLEFKDVSFGYDDDNYVINNISFRINKGDKVALIGGSGSGKSTIVALIAKMYKPDAGEIIINGYKIDNIKKESLYNILTLLEQNPFVFSGTLEENITLGNCIDHNIVNKSILISKMDDLCANCKDNLNFSIAEFGTNLSGGQKQRLCLCRTLAKQSQVIILDEATSALDANLENSIIDNLNDFLCGYNKTLITVSHKPSILKICNKIIHIENGQLRES